MRVAISVRARSARSLCAVAASPSLLRRPVDRSEISSLFESLPQSASSSGELTPLLERLAANRQQEDAWRMYTALRSRESKSSESLLSSEHYGLFLRAVTSRTHRLASRALRVEEDLRSAGHFDERDGEQVAALIRARVHVRDFDGAVSIFEGAKAAAAAAGEPLPVRAVAAHILSLSHEGKAEECLQLYNEHIRTAAEAPSSSIDDDAPSKALAYVMNAYARRGELERAEELLVGSHKVESWHVNALLLACVVRATEAGGARHGGGGADSSRIGIGNGESEEEEHGVALIDNNNNDDLVEASSSAVALPSDGSPAGTTIIKPSQAALAAFEAHIGWDRAKERADEMTTFLLVRAFRESNDLDGMILMRKQFKECGAPISRAMENMTIRTLVDGGRVGAAFRVYEESSEAFGGPPSLHMIHTLTNGCFNMTEAAYDNAERKIWMSRSLKLFNDGQALVAQRNELTKVMEGEEEGDEEDDQLPAQIMPWRQPQPTTETPDLYRLSLFELRKYIRSEFGDKSGISLAVGGAAKRTARDIAKDAYAALSAREPLPEDSFVARNPLLAASRLEVIAKRMEVSQRDEPRGRSSSSRASRRGEDDDNGVNDWAYDMESGRMYPANRRAPFWANADRKKDPMWGGDEEEDEPGARPPKPNTKRAWQEKKKAAKARQWARDAGARR